MQEGIDFELTGADTKEQAMRAMVILEFPSPPCPIRLHTVCHARIAVVSGRSRLRPPWRAPWPHGCGPARGVAAAGRSRTPRLLP